MENQDLLSKLPLASLLAIVLGGAATALWNRTPLEVPRPKGEHIDHPHPGVLQDINARLWEDPLSVIARHDRELKERGVKPPASDKGDILAENICDKVAPRPDHRDQGSRLLVLGVMVSDAPYSEPSEQRARTRYALHSALSVAHFVPDDNQHIGRFAYPLYSSPSKEKNREPLTIPFESFQRLPPLPGPESPQKTGSYAPTIFRVLVLWLQEERFASAAAGKGRPIAETATLFEKVLRSCPKEVTPTHDRAGVEVATAVIGPTNSDTLRTMVIEAENAGKGFATTPHIPTFYSAFATASAIDLLTLEDHPRIPCKDNPNTKSPWPMPDWRSQHLADPRYSGSALSWYFKRCNLNFLSTVSTDEELAHVLLEELQRRDPGHQGVWDEGKNYYVALISERDTYYGRALPRAFVRAAGMAAECADDRLDLPEGASRRREPGTGPSTCRILTYRYLRGLDGQVPPAPQADKSKGESDPKAQAQKIASMERAEGPKQFDHLRRLAARIRADSQLEADAESGSWMKHLGRYGDAQVRAIGVLGTDPYDKIEVLRGLREEFPRAVFFTTDLDARMLDVDQYQWTRNVVVASSFGLELTPCLQKDVPPFRGTYQTSAYLATRLAVHNVFPTEETGRVTWCPEYPEHYWLPAHTGEPIEDDSPRADGNAYRLKLSQVTVDKWLAAPRLFEIGRTAPLSLLDTPARYQRAVGNVHPEADRFVPTTGALLTGLVVLAFICGALLLIEPVRRALLDAGQFIVSVLWNMHPYRRGWWSIALIVAVVLVALEGLVLCAYIEAAVREGEPFRWFEGLSTWPSEIIRACALVVTAVAFFAACGRSTKNLDQVEHDFALPPCDQFKVCRWKRLVGRLERCEAKKQAAPQAVADDAGVTDCMPQTDDCLTIRHFWCTYRVLTSPERCLVRAAVWTLGFMLVGLVLMETLGYPPLPARGKTAVLLDQFLISIVVPAFLMLLFFVAELMRLCERLCNGLVSEQPSDWSWSSDVVRRLLPPSALASESEGSAQALRVVDAWVAVQLVKERTKAIGPLIFPPLLVLSMLVVARSGLFDGWYMPVGLVFMLSTSFVLGLIGAWRLHRTAERVRAHSIGVLENARFQIQGGASAAPFKDEQIKGLIERIKAVREGAFVPPWERPFVVAGLLPLVGAGGVQLFQVLGFGS